MVFDVTAYMSWLDPSLIDLEFHRTVEEYEAQWNPAMEFNDSEILRKFWDGNTAWNLKDKSIGLMKYSQRYLVETRYESRLNLFPF